MAPASPAEVQPPSAPGSEVESPIQRMKRRNLFHPTRGVFSEGAGHSPLHWPVLVGTTLAGRTSFAMLRLATMTEAVSVEKGDAFEGFELVAIEPGRVRLKAKANQEMTWIPLEQPEDSKSVPITSELQALLGGLKAKPASTPGNPK